jgi:hypothetical protein
MGADPCLAAEAALPPLPVGEGTARFLAGVRQDLATLRQRAARHEASRQQLREAAPLIQDALKQGLSQEAIFQVLAANGYAGTRNMLRYFLETRLERELVRQGIASERRRAKPRPRAATAATTPPPASPGQRNGAVTPPPCKFAGVTVFKPNGSPPESEFERRLAHAITHRKQTGEWQQV